MRWKPPTRWKKRFAWLPIGINCGAPGRGLGETAWFEFVYVKYAPPHERQVVTKQEYEHWK